MDPRSPHPRQTGKDNLLPFPAEGSGYPKLAYVSSLGRGPQMAFFIHGTPGVAQDWEAVLRSLGEEGVECSTLSLDRPGFGANEGFANAAELENQVERFVELLDERRDQSKDLILVGHSYGAALAVGLAVRLLEEKVVSGLVLVAGVLSPLMPQRRWYHRVLTWKLVSIFAPTRYVRCAEEMSRVDTHLRLFSLAWQQFDFPVTLIHGDQDSLIPRENSEYVLDKLDPRKVRYLKVPGGGHDLLSSHPDLIAYEVGRLCKVVSQNVSQHEF